MIPYSRQRVTAQDIQAVVKALRSDFLTTGPLVEEYEEKFARKVRYKKAVAVSSGTAALHCAMVIAGISEGAEVIVPAITFQATANAVRYCGGKVVFVDVDPETLLIDYEDVKNKITPNTRAIVGVDYAGQVCDWERLSYIKNEYSVPWLIADCAHSLGVSCTSADLSCFSTHAIKAMTTCGEGGVLAMNFTQQETAAKNFRNHRGLDKRLNYNNNVGYNYRLSDVACAMGISQLDSLYNNVKARQLVARRYDQAFGDVLETLEKIASHAYHLYVIKLENKEQRNRLKERLLAKGIGSQVNYQPVNLLPTYNQPGTCPVAEREWERILSIPCYPGLKEYEQEQVVEVVLG